MNNEKILCKGKFAEIGQNDTEFHHKTFENKKICEDFHDVKNHDDAFNHLKEILTSKEIGVIKSMDEITAIGHRVVHGGEFFTGPVIINDEVIKKIESLIPLAPLHNKASISGIKSCMKMFGNKIPQVAVFDTSYYSGIPDYAFVYPIPYEYYEKCGIRKYGFHGTSHEFVSNAAAKILNKDIKDLKIISCHLGNGSSITAIKNGKAIDTSMGLTPLGGIMMGTRSGSMDPSVVIKMAEEKSLSLEEIGNILNKESGLKGISGVGSDDRDILRAENNGNKRAKLAHEMMIYKITKYIGGYIAILGGCDAIIFTGGIGEHQWMHREKICKYFKFMGLELDDEKNKNAKLGKEEIISKNESKIKVFVIPTNEELAIARFTLKLINNK